MLKNKRNNSQNHIPIFVACVIVVLFFTKPCLALSLPFFSKTPNIIFEDKQYQNQLEVSIEEALEKAYQDRKDQKINLSKEQITLLEKNLIIQILYSKGFYDGKVEYKIAKKEDGKNTYQINPQHPYLIEDVIIKSNSKSIKLPSAKEIGLEEKTTMVADKVLLARNRLEEYIGENYCLWQVQTDYQAIINRKTKRAKIIFSLKPSSQVKFGRVSFEGLKTVDQSYVKNKIKIIQDSCFDKNVIDKAKLDLLKTGLFVDAQTTLEKTKEQKVNVIFKLKERHNKTIKAGVSFSSDEGLILGVGWEHRNLLGKAQDLQIDLKTSRLSQTLGASLNIPAFFSSKQNLIISEELAHKDFKAFNSRSSESSVTLKRKLFEHLTGGVGGNLKISQVDDDISKDSFRLLSTPLTLDYDSRNRDFNPDSGVFIGGKTAPYVDLINNNEYFTKSTIVGTYYHKVDDWPQKPVFAFKLSTGTINHIKASDAPADEKFYVGGSNSVRGYGFQKAGLLKEGTPLGGLSFIETSVESRLKLSKNWGVALFIDGGNNFEQTAPDLKQNLKWAGGFGVRYFTGFMPVRFDIAFPFKRRQGVDSAFQVYIGIGQAF